MNYIVVYRGIFKLRSCKININVIIIRHTHVVQYLGLTQRVRKIMRRRLEREERTRGRHGERRERRERRKRESDRGRDTARGRVNKTERGERVYIC